MRNDHFKILSGTLIKSDSDKRLCFHLLFKHNHQLTCVLHSTSCIALKAIYSLHYFSCAWEDDGLSSSQILDDWLYLLQCYSRWSWSEGRGSVPKDAHPMAAWVWEPGEISVQCREPFHFSESFFVFHVPNEADTMIGKTDSKTELRCGMENTQHISFSSLSMKEEPGSPEKHLGPHINVLK